MLVTLYKEYIYLQIKYCLKQFTYCVILGFYIAVGEVPNFVEYGAR